MNSFIDLIHQVTQFGTKTVILDNKHKTLKKALADVYALYINLESSFDQQVYNDVKRLNYGIVYAQVKLNFPDLGFYSNLDGILDHNNKLQIEKGDALDDLTDLILDLSEVAWRLENTSLNDGLWYFNTLMRVHSEQHLLNLLQYLKALEA
ncbi:DUF5063 domain-containing protein [Leeuwenhoekiella sp. W20_SRS_FM14]|uniref:DUF5063 domain-containing protein n=1 Tax=Leeuwenhoekiella sp. W20_SRS_FM14 TaxID=3240270 RepID=UPI003F9B80A0